MSCNKESDILMTRRLAKVNLEEEEEEEEEDEEESHMAEYNQ